MKKILLAVLALLLLCGCSSEDAPAAEIPCEKQQVMLYTSMQEKQIKAIKKGFEAKYPDICMNYQFGGTGKMRKKLITEVQFGEIKADLIWTGNPSGYIFLKQNRLLNPYISPEARNIDAIFKDSEDYYTGGRIVTAVIGYNTDLVDEKDAPKSWNDLLNPKWKGKIIMADPYSSGSSSYIMSALMQNPDYGPSFFEKLRNNGCMLESGTKATHKQVAEGNYSVCIGLDYVVSNFIDDNAHISMIYPETDGINIFCPIGLVAGGPNEVAGKLLYDYILSPEGQQILVENHLVSIRDDISQPGPSVVERMAGSMELNDLDICHMENKYLKDFDRIFFS